MKYSQATFLFKRSVIALAVVTLVGCASTGGGSGSAPPSGGSGNTGTGNSGGSSDPGTGNSGGSGNTGTGGSGSSGAGGTGSGGAPVGPASATTLATAAPTVKEKSARQVQTWLTQVEKPYANQLGTGNGAGVTVGVIDSGAQTNHPMLTGQFADTFNGFDSSTVVSDQIGHGTHVSGIIAGTTANGAPFEGIAPGAKLLAVKVFNGATSDTGTIGNGIDWAVNVKAAPILNLSLGTSVEAMKAPIQNAVTKGTLLVAALGNDGLTGAASWPAEFAKADWANGQIIAVGAVDSNNKRASFSNMDATLANWTVYAPGVNVASSYSVPGQLNGYSFMSGTSMATPVVAGQAALLKSNWNFLTAKTLAQIIFKTAKRVCSDGSSVEVCKAKTTADSVYGWGVVDITASLQPVGDLNVGTSTGQAVNYAGTKLASSKSGLAAGLSGTNVTAVDSFNRGFLVNLGSSVASQAVVTQSIPVAEDAPVEAKGYAATAQLSSGQGAAVAGALGKLAMSFQQNNGSSYALGYGGADSQYFGLAAKGLTPLSLGGNDNRFATPYFKLMDTATQMGYGFKLAGGTTVKFGTMFQGQTELSGNKNLATMELSKDFGDFTAMSSLGQLQENASLLGFAGQGALALEGPSTTKYFTLAGSKPIVGTLRLSGMMTLGRTEAFRNTANSLIAGTTDSYSAAWSLGLSQSDILKAGDALGLTVSMPMRTMSGSMQVQGAISQNQSDGSLNYGVQNVALAPTGRQHDIELSYRRPLSKTANVTALAQMKLEPGHVASAPTQYGVGLKFTSSF